MIEIMELIPLCHVIQEPGAKGAIWELGNTVAELETATYVSAPQGCQQELALRSSISNA